MSLDPKSKHYDAGGIETIEIIRAKLTPEQFYGYCLGNALKYLCRANHKGDPARDIEKAGVYVMLAKETIEKFPPLGKIFYGEIEKRRSHYAGIRKKRKTEI